MGPHAKVYSPPRAARRPKFAYGAPLARRLPVSGRFGGVFPADASYFRFSLSNGNTRQMYCLRLQAMFLVLSATARCDVESGGCGGEAARAVDLEARQLFRPRLKVILAALLVTPRSRRRRGRGSAAHRRRGEKRPILAQLRYCSAGVGWRFFVPSSFIVAASICTTAACARRWWRRQPILRRRSLLAVGGAWPAARVSTDTAALACTWGRQRAPSARRGTGTVRPHACFTTSPTPTHAPRRWERLQHWWKRPWRPCSSHQRLLRNGCKWDR